MFPRAIQSTVIEAAPYFSHPCTPKSLELLARQFHVRNLSARYLWHTVKERVDATVVCGKSKA